MRRLVFGTVLLLGLLCGACTADGAWDTIRQQQELFSQNLIWQQRVPITLHNTFAQAETLVDFPVLVLLKNSDIDMSRFAPDGSDLRFHDHSIGARLPHEVPALAHEIEHWDPSGVSAVWVRVPRVQAGAPNTRIWLYFDNPGTRDRQRPAEVWSNGYVGVWHLNEDSPPYRDSGPYGLDGNTDLNGYTRPERVAGPTYGYGQDFRADPTPDRGIVIPAHPALESLGPLTISLWLQIDATVNGARFMNKAQIELWITNSQPEFAVNYTDNKMFRSFNNPWTLGSWQHFAMRWDGEPASSGVSLYRDGQQYANIFNSGEPTGERRPDAGVDLIIGNVVSGTPTRPTPGLISSVQVSDVVRSPGWIRATYEGYAGNFVSIGSPETVEYK